MEIEGIIIIQNKKDIYKHHVRIFIFNIIMLIKILTTNKIIFATILIHINLNWIKRWQLLKSDWRTWPSNFKYGVFYLLWKQNIDNQNFSQKSSHVNWASTLILIPHFILIECCICKWNTGCPKCILVTF